MVKLGMVGKVLIHNYPYGAYPNGKLRDELLDGEIFYTLKVAQVLIERWRKHYSAVRPCSSLGYRPPAPVARQPLAPGLPKWGPTTAPELVAL